MATFQEMLKETPQERLKKEKKKKAINGWVMYDWANSAFATTVMAGFFPVFFRGLVACMSLLISINRQ